MGAIRKYMRQIRHVGARQATWGRQGHWHGNMIYLGEDTKEEKPQATAHASRARCTPRQDNDAIILSKSGGGQGESQRPKEAVYSCAYMANIGSLNKPTS